MLMPSRAHHPAFTRLTQLRVARSRLLPSDSIRAAIHLWIGASHDVAEAQFPWRLIRGAVSIRPGDGMAYGRVVPKN
jgi:hypothetical protein